MTALLRLEAVSCIRGGRQLFEALDLTLEPGESMLVGGPNGAGKTSLLRLCAGLLAPASGRVAAARCALADEHMSLDEKNRLGDALGFWAGLEGADPKPAMARMGIDRLSTIPVRMLSAGQRQRANLARILFSDAPLWLLDEPANGLDGDGLDRLGAAIAGHRQAGGAVIIASHQPIDLPGSDQIMLG